MGKCRHVDLTEFFKDATLRSRRRGLSRDILRLLDDLEPGQPDDELSLFADYDTAVRAAGGGYYSEDADECASRRLDMRGPLDFDPGPVEMEEAPAEVEGVWLEFRGRKSA